MRIAGRITVGSSAYAVAADTKRVARFTLPQDANIAKGSVYLDGLGPGVLGAQACRQVIYAQDDSLVAVSDEVMVPLGQPPGWQDFSYSSFKGGLALPQGDFFSGVIAGAYDGTIRVYGDDPHGMGGMENADTYADGASDPFGTATALTADLSCFLTYFLPYSADRPDETDIYFSRLPLADAQAALGSTGPSITTPLLVDAGWHDTFIDPEIGSNALVRDGSPLAGLLGERIRVKATDGAATRSVVAYVHNLADSDAFDWDLSLTRLLFSRLGALSADTVQVTVEVIG